MTLFLDPSALLHRYVETDHTDWVRTQIATDPTWVVSALARTELRMALHRLAIGPRADGQLEQRLRDDFSRMHIVPIDDRCLRRATELGMTFGLRTIDATHVAAADRLPRPAQFLTLDRQQIPAAAELGFEVLAPVS